MKYTFIVIVFCAFASFSCAQTASPSKANPSTSTTAAVPASPKADCPCCQKMSDGKAMESCCTHHADVSGKAEMPCCKGKEGNDAMSCMKADKDKPADASSANGMCCAGKEKEGCCSKSDKTTSDKTTEHAVMACCGANGEQCGMAHHDHADINK